MQFLRNPILNFLFGPDIPAVAKWWQTCASTATMPYSAVWAKRKVFWPQPRSCCRVCKCHSTWSSQMSEQVSSSPTA
jgi:hypothetical protein